jgi:hypothetical protein
MVVFQKGVGINYWEAETASFFIMVANSVPAKAARPPGIAATRKVSHRTAQGEPTPNISAIRDERIASFAKWIYKACTNQPKPLARKPVKNAAKLFLIAHALSKNAGMKRAHHGSKRAMTQEKIKIPKNAFAIISIKLLG